MRTMKRRFRLVPVKIMRIAVAAAAAAVVAAASLCGAVFAADEGAPGVFVELNGRRVSFPDQQPVIVDGRVLVPARGVFEQLGYDVKWNPVTNTATISNETNHVILILGEATFVADGSPGLLDVPARILNGRTMLPFRAVLESVGCDVDWDAGRQTVVIVAAVPARAGGGAGGAAGSADAIVPRDASGKPMTPRDLPPLLSGVWTRDSADGVFAEYVQLASTGDHSGEYISNTLHKELGFTTYYERGTYAINKSPEVDSEGIVYYTVNISRQAYVTNGYYTNPEANPAASPAYSAERPALRYIRMVNDGDYRYCGDSAYNHYALAEKMPPENWSDGLRRLGSAPPPAAPASISAGWETRTNAQGDVLTGKFSRTTGYLIEGKAVLRSGTVYEGAFDQYSGQLIEGTAKLTSNGAVYEGTFDKDTGNLITGKLTLRSGDVFSGAFDRASGRLAEGAAALQSGVLLEGSFASGTGQLARGRRTAPDGSIFEGEFGAGGYMSQGKGSEAGGTVFEGSFAGGYPAYGLVRFANGYVYEGSFDGAGQPLNGTLTLDGKLFCSYLNGAAHLSGVSGASTNPGGWFDGGWGEAKAEIIDWTGATMSGAGLERAGSSR